jgi:uncharacterized protein YcnI
MRRLLPVIGVAAAFAAAAPPALAHIQVLPTSAAPGDPVMWEVLVPGESEARTVKVEVQVPEGVLPFSYEDTPGWKRELTLADDQSVDVITWTGRLASDGFVRFSFLASTPEQEGTIEWKAIQTYDDGSEAAWIEGPNSESPAPVTEISASAPRQNAGGEGAEAADEGAPPADGEATPAPADAEPAAATDDDGGSDTLPIVLGAVGVLLGAAALVVALRRRSPLPG